MYAEHMYAEQLTSQADPFDVLLALRGSCRLAALFGSWSAGEAIIGIEPVADLESWDAIDLPASGDAGSSQGSFGGGWMGSWGYQCGRHVETLTDPPPRPHSGPEARVGFYDTVLRWNAGAWTLETLASPDTSRWRRLTQALATAGQPMSYSVGTMRATGGLGRHREGVARALEHIRAGNIFQVNLCASLEADFSGDPLDVFVTGARKLRPAYGAFFDFGDSAIASFSPELFLRRHQDRVITSPIKGTASLDTDPEELASSAKNRAENTMIVDLMRNDLSRVCEPGSVRVPALNRLERHAVYHLVSDVTGTLNVSDSALLRATFPPGSVTGAPKVRAMDIINELEAVGREAYTGAIGHISPVAGLEMSVVIRTFEFSGDRVWLGVGGGIVADSTPESEVAECIVKAAPLIAAIGAELDDEGFAAPPSKNTHSPAEPRQHAAVSEGVFDTILVRDGQAQRTSDHLARLARSVTELWSQELPAKLESDVQQAASTTTGLARLKITVKPALGSPMITIETGPLTPRDGADRLLTRVLTGGLGPHKWVDRSALESEHELLVCDADGSVLETSTGSVFVVADDGLHTPPADGRILPGTMRECVIHRAAALGIPTHERRLTVDDLVAASEVFYTNALRGPVAVTQLDGVERWQAGPVAALLARDPEPPTRISLPKPSRVLFIDNYDSFVYNLVHYVRELGCTTEVIRNDEMTADELCERSADFDQIIISPGPGTPADAGVSAELVRALSGRKPILGVCLGHQVIAEVFGARVRRADHVFHGKPSLIHHDGAGVFAHVPSPVVAARYHSLIVDHLPPELVVTARTGAGDIMGIAHREHPTFGVQIHPESILTRHGHDMLATFLGFPG